MVGSTLKFAYIMSIWPHITTSGLKGAIVDSACFPFHLLVSEMNYLKCLTTKMVVWPLQFIPVSRLTADISVEIPVTYCCSCDHRIFVRSVMERHTVYRDQVRVKLWQRKRVEKAPERKTGQTADMSEKRTRDYVFGFKINIWFYYFHQPISYFLSKCRCREQRQSSKETNDTQLKSGNHFVCHKNVKTDRTVE